jgi:hypothetical protein
MGRGSPQSLGSQSPSCRRQWRQGRNWGARDLQNQLRYRRQDPTYGDQHSASAHIQRRRKLKEFFAFAVSAADEYGYGERQPCPLTTFGLPPHGPHPRLSIVPPRINGFKHIVCQIYGQYPTKIRKWRNPPPPITVKPLTIQDSAGCRFVFYSVFKTHPRRGPTDPNCNLLLHLGNSVSFLVDTKSMPVIRFQYWHSCL